MSPAEVNMLPPRVRSYIHELHTNADPAGTVRELAQLKDTNRALQLMYRRAVSPRPVSCGCTVTPCGCPK